MGGQDLTQDFSFVVTRSESRGFVVNVSGPHNGWWEVALEVDEGGEMTPVIKEEAKAILRGAGFTRPHDNWEDWDREEVTYMRIPTVYHKLRVRKSPKEGDSDA
jgi:hypothetical protein